MGRERGANSGSWLVACRSHQFFDFPVWFPPHGVSRRDQTTVRLAQAQEVFEPFPSLGRGLHLAPRFRKSTSDLDSDAATEWGHTEWALLARQPVQKSPLRKLAAGAMQEETPMQVILALLHSSETLH